MVVSLTDDETDIGQSKVSCGTTVLYRLRMFTFLTYSESDKN